MLRPKGRAKPYHCPAAANKPVDEEGRQQRASTKRESQSLCTDGVTAEASSFRNWFDNRTPEMSLNGLDDAKVKEAHEAAVAEAGGWYVTALSVWCLRDLRLLPLALVSNVCFVSKVC